MSTSLPPTTLIFAPKGRRPLALPISRGQVIVVSDASGILPNDWQLSLIENSPSGTARIIQDGDVLSRDLLHLVGFNLPLPDLPVREYLATFCADTASILNEFELSDVAELSCAYLPPAPSRQIALLHAFSQERGIIVLNDPFLPFNGRWRESFAAFIAEQASLGGAAVVCCNVGFMPKTWATLPSVKTQDVAGLLPLPPETRVQSPQPTSEHSSTASPPPPPPRQTNEANAAYYAPGIPLPIPASAIKIYREVKDWVFEPLATASRFLRTWSGIVVTLGLSVVLGTMGVLLVPNLPEARALLVRLSEKFNYGWKDLTNSSPQSPTKAEESDLNKPTTLANDVPAQQISGEEFKGKDVDSTSEGIRAEDQIPSPLFPVVSGIPLTVEIPLFSLHIVEPSHDEGESAALIPTLITRLATDDSNIFIPFGSQVSPALSYTCTPFAPCIGWVENLQNLQSADSIEVLPENIEKSETEITPQGDTDPLATQE